MEPERRSRHWAIGSQILRRRGDLFGVANVLGVLLVSHTWTVPKAMELTNSDLLLPLWLLLLLLFLAHWAAVLGYGPGRPEAAGKRCEARAGAPGALGHLLAHGVELPRPTTAEVAWCRSCEAEKPPVASHCHQCNRCCFWMDHHCNFFGQCVGFRNLRCFIVALVYGNLMCIYLVALTFILWSQPTFLSLDWFLLILWTVYILWWWQKVWHFLRCACWEVITGWRSSVLRMKLSQWQVSASEQGAELRPAHEKDSALQRAFSAVLLLPWEPTHPLGIFLDPGTFGQWSSCRQQFEATFGSQVSWRWLLPLPGGEGDPCDLRVSSKACDLWLQLANAVKLQAAA
eukprot:g31759.t1